MPLRETVHVVVDDKTIANGTHWDVLHPVWWKANIYDGPEAYELSLQPFSQAQRFLFAVRWYISEVNNGGHDQFYTNWTGVVWMDARAGWQAMGVPKAADILSVSADRLGGSPSLEHDERLQQLDSMRPDFDDCDEAFYTLQKKLDVEAKMMECVRSRPSDFYFSGMIERVVLPRLRKQ